MFSEMKFVCPFASRFRCPAGFLTILGIFSFSITSIPGQAQGPPGGGAPTAVIVALAEKDQMDDRIEALGTLRSRESVELSATVSERVVEVGFEDGERVEAGQVLLKLYRAEEEALLNEAKATLEMAELDYARALQLAERGAAAQSFLDETRRNVHTSRARVLAIESRLGRMVVEAPFDGVVGLRNISVGALARPGELITTIDDDSVMLLDFPVPSVFLPVLIPGASVTASAVGFEGREFTGEIRSVSSRVDPVTRTVVVRAEMPNPDRVMRPGLLMTVELPANRRDAVLVPEEALVPRGYKTSLFVVEMDESGAEVARMREVETGTRRDGRVEITSGLVGGEKVITHGTMKAGDGALVRVLAVDDGSRTLAEMLAGGNK